MSRMIRVGGIIVLAFIIMSLLVDVVKKHQQRQNVGQIRRLENPKRIMPHRINTEKRLAAIWNDGFRGFELDAHFVVEPNPLFLLGHDEKDFREVSLIQFLRQLPSQELETIWLDLKNLSSENARDVQQHLEQIDAEFDLKEKLILESRWIDTRFNIFAENGWHTSFYLPNDRLLRFLEQGNADAMRDVANKLSNQARRQKLGALSFDCRVYPFINEYFEPLRPQGLLYHCWDLSLKLHYRNVVSTLQEQIFFHDTAINRLLLPYYHED